MSAALITGGRSLGAIKVYSTATDAYSDRDADLLRRFATQAAIFVSNVQTMQVAGQMSDTLKQTLRSRDVLAMARGIVMARNHISPDEAFRRLVAESHTSRRVQAFESAALTVEDLWLRYFALGGVASRFELEAYLNGALALPPLQHDIVAHAIKSTSPSPTRPPTRRPADVTRPPTS